MFLIRLFRFICGYVAFSGNGGFPERFINLCACNSIALWDTRASGGILNAKTTVAGYKKIRKCAKKSGMKIRIKQKCGLPFLAAPYIKRKGLFAGAVISVILVSVLSSAVWTIEVSGNELYTSEQITEIAEKYGVFSGAFKKSINLRDIRTDVKTDIDKLSWFSVNIDGCHAQLLVSESSGTTEIIDTRKPCNIISDTGGEVLKIETQTGTPVPSVGSAVAEGDLLISGVTEKSDGSVYFVHARGTAVIRTTERAEIKIPFTINIEQAEETKLRHHIRLFFLTIPVSLKPQGACIRSEARLLTYKGNALPVGIITDIYEKTTENELTLTSSQASSLASYMLFTNEKEALRNATTESKKITINSDEKYAYAVSEHIIHKTTGIENYFDVDYQNN